MGKGEGGYYIVCVSHRVPQAFPPVVRIGSPRPSHPQASVPSLWFRGGGHTRLRERGAGSQFGQRDRHHSILGRV
jgi:hypothetical protein